MQLEGYKTGLMMSIYSQSSSHDNNALLLLALLLFGWQNSKLLDKYINKSRYPEKLHFPADFQIVKYPREIANPSL